jgi:hypothetical protein
MRLLIVVSRLEAVRPVTDPTAPVTEPTAPVTLATLPVRLPVKVVVKDVVTVVAALVPAMKCPPAAPGTLPLVNRLLPMLPAVVKSPAVVSCQTPVAMVAAVSWFVTVVTVGIVTPDCVAWSSTLPAELLMAAVPVPSTSNAPALPLATLGRAVRPPRTAS